MPGYPPPRRFPSHGQSALERAIGRRIAQLDPWEVDRARWGRRIADRRHQPTTRRQQLASRILERVEIDHSPLKVVVGNEAGPIGQPWLTVLIDYYSRMIIGFCLGFRAAFLRRDHGGAAERDSSQDLSPGALSQECQGRGPVSAFPKNSSAIAAPT